MHYCHPTRRARVRSQVLAGAMAAKRCSADAALAAAAAARVAVGRDELAQRCAIEAKETKDRIDEANRRYKEHLERVNKRINDGACVVVFCLAFVRRQVRGRVRGHARASAPQNCLYSDMRSWKRATARGLLA